MLRYFKTRSALMRSQRIAQINVRYFKESQWCELMALDEAKLMSQQLMQHELDAVPSYRSWYLLPGEDTLLNKRVKRQLFQLIFRECLEASKLCWLSLIMLLLQLPHWIKYLVCIIFQLKYWRLVLGTKE